MIHNELPFAKGQRLFNDSLTEALKPFNVTVESFNEQFPGVRVLMWLRFMYAPVGNTLYISRMPSKDLETPANHKQFKENFERS